MERMVWSQVRHLYEIEHLSIRQIAKKLRMARKSVSKVIHTMNAFFALTRIRFFGPMSD